MYKSEAIRYFGNLTKLAQAAGVKLPSASAWGELTYGPNPDHVFRSLLDQLTSETAKANPQRSGRINRLRNSTESLYNFVAGKTQPIANPHIARWSDTAPRTG